jgi:hypothetical protein
MINLFYYGPVKKEVGWVWDLNLRKFNFIHPIYTLTRKIIFLLINPKK